ncbi:DUF6230 family protein [Saccharopolyspora griseoalba]|uniref:DUF6230 family protein n=1 Tax=Saccharopolyspora griseoalba TaxID=1431848 RepID=A0ABW2LTF8_9PSEU
MSTAGRIRWVRFALALGGGVAGLGVMLGGVASGTVAASFSVSGTAYKATASRMVADGVVQYGAQDDAAGTPRPVVVNGFKQATMDDFCQSILVPLPMGEATIKITAPGGMSAENLVLGLDWAAGDLTMTNADLGVDAGELTKGPSIGEPGTFGVQADRVEFDNLRQVAWTTTASTLRLNEVRIEALAGRKECF